MKKYIITDPCYVMDKEQYQKICDLYEKFREMGLNPNGLDPFEAQIFPLKSKHCETGEPIIFHIIKGTPGGDGSYDFKDEDGKTYDIGVDAGMLCIAECEKGWENEQFGAHFETLEDAKYHFPNILRHF